MEKAKQAHSTHSVQVYTPPCCPTHTDTRSYIFLCLTSTPSSISAGMRVFLNKDRGGDSIYYNLLEPQGLPTSYFILMYLHSQPHIFPRLTIARKTSEVRNNNGKAGDLVFTVSLTLALSGASISQQIKLPKLDCALAGRCETSLESQTGTMGFCWSGECGIRPCQAGHYMPCRAGWVGPTGLLCIYGFCSMMRPIEPFLTEFLTGTYKNLTTEQVRVLSYEMGYLTALQ